MLVLITCHPDHLQGQLCTARTKLGATTFLPCPTKRSNLPKYLRQGLRGTTQLVSKALYGRSLAVGGQVKIFHPEHVIYKLIFYNLVLHRPLQPTHNDLNILAQWNQHYVIPTSLSNTQQAGTQRRPQLHYCCKC